jgi:hypothetical protein
VKRLYDARARKGKWTEQEDKDLMEWVVRQAGTDGLVRSTARAGAGSASRRASIDRKRTAGPGGETCSAPSPTGKPVCCALDSFLRVVMLTSPRAVD